MASANVLNLGGTAGGYASCPDIAGYPTGDYEWHMRLSLPDGQPAAFMWMWGKRQGAGQRSNYCLLNTAGTLGNSMSVDGTTELTAATSSTAAFANGAVTATWVKVTVDVDSGGGNRTTTFYTGTTDTNDYTSVSYSALGTAQVQAGTGGVFNSTAPLEIGTVVTGATNLLVASVYAFVMLDGIGGTAVANPIFANQKSGTTSFADAAGNTWTIGGASITGAGASGPKGGHRGRLIG